MSLNALETLSSSIHSDSADLRALLQTGSVEASAETRGRGMGWRWCATVEKHFQVEEKLPASSNLQE